MSSRDFDKSTDITNATAELPIDEELAIKDRALAASAEGITISDARLPDNPLVYINAGFERLTGYTARSMLGKNCRFLQGPQTDPRARSTIRQALKEKKECTVEILNYRKDGTSFWNRLSITPVHDPSGQVTHFIGIQSDITARKLAEERLMQANEHLEEANQRMKKDLEMAARVQQSLLPQADFSVPGVVLSWILKPCDELAGDTLNVVRLDQDHLGIYIIDVSGHGVSSSLLSFTLSRWMSPIRDHSSLYQREGNSQECYQIVSPAQVAEKLNQQFPMDLETGQYFTFFYGILHLKTGRFTYVNAGHPGPVFLSVDSETIALASSNYPIGLFQDARYQENSLSLKRNDRLVLYTDGLVEASNHREEEFGFQRLLENLRKTRGLPLRESLDAVLRAVENWYGSNQQRDDISLLAVEYQPLTKANRRK